MHNVALRRLLVQQRAEDLEREALRLRLGRRPSGPSRRARIAHAIRAGALAYRSLAPVPGPVGSTCVIGEAVGVLAWTSTPYGAPALTCRIERTDGRAGA